MIMEQLDGVPAEIPPLAVFPEETSKSQLAESEWQAYLDSWLLSLEIRLRLQNGVFSRLKLSQDNSGIPFLISYFQNESRSTKPRLSGSKEHLLYRRAYLLLKRLLLNTGLPYDIPSEQLIHLVSIASLTYASSSDWRLSLKTSWKRCPASFSAGLDAWKLSISQELPSQIDNLSMQSKLHQLNALVKCCSEAGLTLMTGSDYCETLMAAYKSTEVNQNSTSSRRMLTEHIFYCLRSLMSASSQNTSLLLDQLFFMKSEADARQKENARSITLFSSLICSTSLLRHLAADSSIIATRRGQLLVDTLKQYKHQNLHLHPPTENPKRRLEKGKAKARPSSDIHVHKATQISQVHDLFPNLGNGYILRLLDYFQDDVEAVVAALLEPDSLPSHLRDQDTSNDIPAAFDETIHDLAPRSTPPILPQRRNVFDGDDFDKLQISSGKLHKGRKEISLDDHQNADESTRRKAAIMSALANFDSDDDERDDTYDVADVGGTVDDTLDTDRRNDSQNNQCKMPMKKLFSEFGKRIKPFLQEIVRPGSPKVRQDLKRDTDMTDEQIEGWAIMLQRNSALQNRLERKYAAARSFRSNQNTIKSTRWQANNSEDELQEDTGDDSNQDRNTYQTSHRGNPPSRGDRGGTTSASRGGASTQMARKRKEQGRGRGGANHGRREGRARKMGRGMAG